MLKAALYLLCFLTFSLNSARAEDNEQGVVRSGKSDLSVPAVVAPIQPASSEESDEFTIDFEGIQMYRIKNSGKRFNFKMIPAGTKVKVLEHFGLNTLVQLSDGTKTFIRKATVKKFLKAKKQTPQAEKKAKPEKKKIDETQIAGPDQASLDPKVIELEYGKDENQTEAGQCDGSPECLAKQQKIEVKQNFNCSVNPTTVAKRIAQEAMEMPVRTKYACGKAVRTSIGNARIYKGGPLDASAKRFGPRLIELGFTNDIEKFKRNGRIDYKNIPAGAVMVYKGTQSLSKVCPANSTGNCHGHAEIKGTDGKYYHFIKNSRPISLINGNRHLIGIYIFKECKTAICKKTYDTCKK